MKTRYLFLLFLSLRLGLSAQEPKGVTPIATSSNFELQTSNSIRAVVVGISDYHDPAIPDLQFADRDARAFAAWLQSKAGGSVPADNIQLLTNEKATVAQVGLALNWLLETSQEGDVAVIYFSGHGDLDSKKMRDQWGYLLTWNTQAAIYIASAYPLNYLQNIVSTLSIDMKVRVELFLDACHSGKLAGSAIGGGQATAQSLSRQFANEVKVLSCQPNEFSIEGEQWGGGRGAFSFHLIEGLTGLADKNTDGMVSLGEMDRYLGDVVPPETAPQPQTPFTTGDRNATLARVDAPTLAALREHKTAPGDLRPIVLKGLEDEVLARADSAERQQYLSFKNALATGNLLEPATACADFFYTKLIINETFKPLAGLMRRNFAAALADDAQQALNAILSDDPFEINAWALNPAKYKLYPLYLQRTLELIGESNYLYRSLMAKKLYFEGYNLYFNVGAIADSPAVRDSFRQEAKKAFLKCLEYEPGAAYAYYSIGSLVEKMGDYAQAEKNLVWLKKAVEFAPNWKQPYINIAEVYLNWLGELDSTETWLMKAYALDSTSYLLLQEISWLRQYQHRPEEANAICRKLIALRPDLPNAYFTMGHTLFFLQGKVEEAAPFFQKGKALDAKAALQLNIPERPFCPVSLMLKNRRQQEAITCLEEAIRREDLSNELKSYHQMLLAEVYVQLRDFDRAAECIRKSEEISDSSAWVISETAKGRMQLLQGHFDEAEKTLRYVLTIDKTTNDSWILQWALLGCVKAAQNHPADAETYFKKATSYFGGNSANYAWEEAWFLYGQFLLAQNRDTEALHAFEKTEEVYPNGYFAPYGRSLLEAKKGHKTEALNWLEHSLDRYYPIPQPLYEEPLFGKIRNTKRFKAMMAKNFPPGWEKR